MKPVVALTQAASEKMRADVMIPNAELQASLALVKQIFQRHANPNALSNETFSKKLARADARRRALVGAACSGVALTPILNRLFTNSEHNNSA